MTRLVYTAATRQDVDGIWDYIAIEHSAPEAANKLIDQFDERLQALRTFPELGEAVPHLRPRTRRLVHGRYLLFYEPLEREILLLRVLDGSRLIEESSFS